MYLSMVPSSAPQQGSRKDARRIGREGWGGGHFALGPSCIITRDRNTPLNRTVILIHNQKG